MKTSKASRLFCGVLAIQFGAGLKACVLVIFPALQECELLGNSTQLPRHDHL